MSGVYHIVASPVIPAQAGISSESVRIIMGFPPSREFMVERQRLLARAGNFAGKRKGTSVPETQKKTFIGQGYHEHIMTEKIAENRRTDSKNVRTNYVNVCTNHVNVHTNHINVCTNHVNVHTNHINVCTNHVKVCTNHVKVCTNHVKVCTDLRFLKTFLLLNNDYFIEKQANYTSRGFILRIVFSPDCFRLRLI